MDKQEYKEYAMGLNRSDDKDGKLHILANQQHSLLSKMATLINDYENRIYESSEKITRSDVTNLILAIEEFYAKVETNHNLIIRTAEENLRQNGLIHGPYAMEQYKFNQNASWFKELSERNLDYANKIKAMCSSRENLMPKAPKKLEEFMFLSSMASQYAWVKPDYRGIEDPYDRKKAQEVYEQFVRKAPMLKVKIAKMKGNSFFIYNTQFLDNPELQNTLQKGERALNNPIRMITRPSYKFASKVMQATKLFGRYVSNGIDYYNSEKPRDKSKSPINLQNIRELCKEILKSNEHE